MRRFLSTLLALAACVVLPVALLAGWLTAVLDSTDRYVDTVGPLATDPAVTSAVEQTLTDRVVSTVVDRAPGGADLASDLGPLVVQGVRTAVGSEQFRQVWEAANADAHRQLLAELRSTSPEAGDDIRLDLGSVLRSVVDEVSASLPVSVDVPDTAVPITVLRGEQVTQVREGYDLLTVAGYWLPLAWVGLVVLALLLSPLRARLLALLGLGSAATLALLLLALSLARDRVTAQVPDADRGLSAAVWDGLTTSLDRSVYVGLAVCLLLVVVGLVGGSRRAA